MRLTNQTKRKRRREDLMKYLNLENDLPVSRLYDVITVSDASFLEDDYGCHMGYAILIVIKDTIEIPGERPYKGYHVFYTSGYGTEAADSGLAEQMALFKAASETAQLLKYHLNKDKDFAPKVLMLTDYRGFAGSVFRGIQSWPARHKDYGFGTCTRQWIGSILPRCYVTVKHMSTEACKAMKIVDICSKRMRIAGLTGEVVDRPRLVKSS